MAIKLFKHIDDDHVETVFLIILTIITTTDIDCIEIEFSIFVLFSMKLFFLFFSFFLEQNFQLNKQTQKQNKQN